MEILKDIIGNYWKNVVILILLLVISCSCSTRKVETQKAKEETKTEIKKDIETVVIENNESQEVEIEPIDTSKVLVINGKTYKNAKLRFVNKKAEIKTVIKDKSKAVTATKKQSKEKVTERKSISFWWLLLLLIPILYFYVKSKN